MLKYYYTSHEGGFYHVAYVNMTRHEFMKHIELASENPNNVIQAWRGRALRESQFMPSWHSLVIEPGLRYDMVNRSWDTDSRLYKELESLV